MHFTLLTSIILIFSYTIPLISSQADIKQHEIIYQRTDYIKRKLRIGKLSGNSPAERTFRAMPCQYWQQMFAFIATSIWKLDEIVKTPTTYKLYSSLNCIESLDDKHIITGSNIGIDNIMHIYTIEDRCTLSDTIQLPQNDTISVLLPLGNHQVIIGYQSGNITAWSLTSKTCIQKFAPTHIHKIIALKACGRRTFASVALGESNIQIWNTSSPESCGTLSGHTDAVNTLATLPSKYLASGSKDTTIKLWDPLSQKQLKTLTGHTFEITHLAGLPSKRLVSVDEKGTIKLWDSSLELCTNFQSNHLYLSSLITLKDDKLAMVSLEKIHIYDALGNHVTTISTPGGDGHFFRYLAAPHQNIIISSIAKSDSLMIYRPIPDCGRHLEVNETSSASSSSSSTTASHISPPKPSASSCIIS
jgi:WD40 repeat protein